ncbi:MAG: DNA-3-methyladenine glycosylase I [Bacteroidetes bacterium]|jgi:DNA-3-methyladenine glycosylase I|nr:DNA-3-methyladenine glycosylase I [Bacteroidota bacterium]MBT4399396.1 DNA-3-methyladenine glycosylase I [Bacteroidota bacterium]MBT4409795.1 DNA-3-methyladenine glycosylase I [Bacteroidota bacterium]MBT6006092.1 DNA-3-methyladenine glycosylase I [Prolixibacteraceae bacterium]MBT7465686.1 DNA-3-methyladenine glycosylase I [Bacteroidota bacterium]
MVIRCDWPSNDPLMIDYHDHEWGVIVHDDKKWFEFIVLDAFQAGLSWRTVLHKRDNFRKALDDFDPVIIAQYDEAKVKSLMLDAGIIRNQLKIRATVSNALAFMEIQKEHGSFDNYIWSFTKEKVVQNSWNSMNEVPASTSLSDEISKSLKSKGFKFVGSTIVYAFLQSGGIVNDHVCECFRYRELGG